MGPKRGGSLITSLRNPLGGDEIVPSSIIRLILVIGKARAFVAAHDRNKIYVFKW